MKIATSNVGIQFRKFVYGVHWINLYQWNLFSEVLNLDSDRFQAERWRKTNFSLKIIHVVRMLTPKQYFYYIKVELFSSYIGAIQSRINPLKVSEPQSLRHGTSIADSLDNFTSLVFYPFLQVYNTTKLYLDWNLLTNNRTSFSGGLILVLYDIERNWIKM